MTAPIEFSIAARDESARTGILRTAHGDVSTPVFMPVGTRAAVKAMSPDELWGMGYRMVLANAYHLLVRPGPGARMGGWALWPFGATLPDSGGFQAIVWEISRSRRTGSADRTRGPGGDDAQRDRSARALGAAIMMVLDNAPCG